MFVGSALLALAKRVLFLDQRTHGILTTFCPCLEHRVEAVPRIRVELGRRCHTLLFVQWFFLYLVVAVVGVASAPTFLGGGASERR